MWFRSTRLPRRDSSARTPYFRPQVDALEDRCLLSAAGALDTTFGGTGQVTTSLSKGNDTANAVLIQPWDGKVVVAGSNGSGMALARYNPNGALDSSFGNAGTVVSKIGTTWWNAAALYPSTDTSGNAKKIVEAGAGSLARFNTNGSVDTSFGSRGLVTVPWAIAGVVILPDGQIVVGGDNGSAFELSRYNANGTLDTTFGTRGTATVSVPAGVGANALALQAYGQLVVAGTYGPGPGAGWELARLNSNGTLDSSFGNAGTVTLTFGAGAGPLRGLAIYPGTGTDTADYGKIEVAGTINGNPVPPGLNSNQIAVARLNPDGTPDNSFGQSGQVVTPFPNSGGMAWATALQGDGKVVVAGQTLVGATWVFSLLRYDTNGSPDTSFGNGGLVQTANGYSRAWGVAIQADGRIVAAGSTDGNTGWDFMTARYLPGPEIGTFTTSAATVTVGGSLTLTASNLTDGDPSATVAQVAFYAVDQSGNQFLLGATLSSGIWTLTTTVGLPPGSYTLFAQATDSSDIVGDSAFLPLTVE
jgi:uncharacterized delta-60 repeat protein